MAASLFISSPSNDTYVDQVFGHQGGGAPIRNASNGAVKARLAGDTDILLPNAARANPNFDRLALRHVISMSMNAIVC